MRPRVSFLVAAALLLAGCAGKKVEPVGPAPPEDKRAAAMHADAGELAALRARAAALRQASSGTRLYHVAKAEAWLDFATDAGRDELGIETAAAALRESALLIAGLEKREAPLWRTLHILASRRVRHDLWGLAEGMKASAGLRCVAEPLARAEVALVWAGHKAFLGDGKGAQEIGARAEWYLDAARGEFRRCMETAATPPVSAAPAPQTPATAKAAPPPAVGQPAKHVEVVRLRTDTLFSFGAATLGAHTREVLEQLAARIHALPGVVALRINGHTDRLSRSGAAFNRQLSLARANAVRDALIGAGIAAHLVVVRGEGDAIPLVECPGERNAQTIDCLAPNRRVEVEIERVH